MCPDSPARSPAALAMLMMLPDLWAVMTGAACFMPNIVPRTLVADTASKCSPVTSVMPTIGEAGARVVHQAVEPTERRHRVRDDRPGARLVGDVGAHEAQRRPAALLQRPTLFLP